MVIYIQPRQGPQLIETVEKLGDMTSELRVQGLDTVTGTVEKTVCNVWGITLNFKASKFLNIDVIRDMIQRGTGEEPTTVNVHIERKIKHKRKGGGTVSIVTEHEDIQNIIFQETVIR